MEGLSLVDEDEGLTCNAQQCQAPAMEHLQLCLVGRFLEDKPILANIMTGLLSSVWCPGRGVTIKDFVQGSFLFQF